MTKYNWKLLLLSILLVLLVGCGEAEQQSSNGENDSSQNANSQTDQGTDDQEGSDEEDDSTSNDENEGQFDLNTEEDFDYGTLSWNTYENERFGFSIYYPADWVIGEQSQNGDGLNLYEGDPDNEVLVYGALYDEDIYDPFSDAEKEGFQRDIITMDNGEEADYIVGMEDGKVHFKVIRIIGWEVYTFYAIVTPEFFDENLGLLLQTAKSLNVKVIE